MLKLIGKQLTKNFTFGEYQTDCSDEVCFLTDKALLHAHLLQHLRDYLDRPVFVSSWYRTKSYNSKIGGVPDSNHLTGCATDIYFSRLRYSSFIRVARKWKSLCESHGVVGEIGYYPDDGFIHVGSSIRYSDTFFNWKTENGKQINGYYNTRLK